MKQKHKFPKLAEWLYNEDTGAFAWRESSDQGGRLYRIHKENGLYWEVDIIHQDRSTASLNKYFPRSRDALAALRRDRYFK